jgi:hypothetical protein
MDSDLLSTASGRAGLKATLTLASEAVLRQICINRGLETYNKDRGELEEAVLMLINALDRQAEMSQEQEMRMAELQGPPEATKAAPSSVFSAAEPVPKEDEEENVVYDRSRDEAGRFQEQLLRERAEDKQSIASLTLEVDALRQELEDRIAVENDTKNKQKELAKRVQELWAVTECEPVDKLSFLSEVEALSTPTVEVLDVYEMELERLTDMLPLMEAATRREFILERMHGLVNQNSQFARGNAQQLRQREEFIRELSRLNEQLAQALPAFEKKYSRVFYYKGMPYLEQIHKTSQDSVTRDIERAKSPSRTASPGRVRASPVGPSPGTRKASPGRHARLSPAAQQTINEARFQRALGERALSPRNNASRAMSPRRQNTVWR